MKNLKFILMMVAFLFVTVTQNSFAQEKSKEVKKEQKEVKQIKTLQNNNLNSENAKRLEALKLRLKNATPEQRKEIIEKMNSLSNNNGRKMQEIHQINGVKEINGKRSVVYNKNTNEQSREKMLIQRSESLNKAKKQLELDKKEGKISKEEIEARESKIKAVEERLNKLKQSSVESSSKLKKAEKIKQ